MIGRRRVYDGVRIITGDGSIIITGEDQFGHCEPAASILTSVASTWGSLQDP